MKADLLRRIDQEQNGNGKRAYGVPASSGTGLPYSASQTPQPVTIPVSLETGKLHPSWLPDFTTSSGYGENSPSGQQIIAPWVYLVTPLPAGATVITVTANGMAVGDNITLSHASMPNEEAVITGGPVPVGALYEYTLSRPNEQHDYPAYAMAYNRGNVADGGWVTIVSGDQSDNLKAPHINLWAYEDGAAVRKVRLGLLSGLSAGEKAQFPTVTDWDRYSLYADDAFLRGQIIATSGNLSGNLDVGGTLRVRSGVGESGIVLGTVEGGYGINLLNTNGRPTFAAVSPYEDSDVAVYFDDGHGEKDFYFHKVGDRYQLEIKVDTLIDGTLQANNILIGTGTYPGAFVGLHLGKETGFTGYGTDFAPSAAWDARDGRIYFGGRFGSGWEGWFDHLGQTIDSSVIDPDADPLEHTITWLQKTSLFSRYPEGKVVGAAIGSTPGVWFAYSRRDRRDVLADRGGDLTAQDQELSPSYLNSSLYLRAGGLTELDAQAIQITASENLSIKVGDGSASFFRAERVEMPAVDIANGLIFTNITDQGSFVGIGTKTPMGARLIAEADSIAQIRAQRSGGAAYAAVTVTAADEAWISASGSIVLAPHAGFQAPNYVLPPSATRKVSIGSLARPFEEVYARHGHFGTLGSQSALTGSMYLTRSAPALAANMEADNVLAYFEDANLLPGAYIRYEDTETHAVEVIAITSTGRAAMVEEQEAWEYDVYRAAEGTAQLWYAGTVGVHLGGNNTDGYVRMVGLDDNNAAIGPAMVVFQRDNGEAAANVSERAAFGNLNGYFRYTDPIYGFAAGRKEGSWVSVDEFNGFRVMFGETQLARYREAIDLGDEDGAHIHIDPDDVTLYAGPTPVIELLGTGDANITGTLAVATGGAITWAGGKGRADDTGLEHTEDATNYFSLKPTDDKFLNVVSDMSETTIYAFNTGAEKSSAIQGQASGIDTAGVYGLAQGAGGVGVRAVAGGAATTALAISGGIVDGGSQRYTAMGDATAATDGLNMQTGDARYAAIGGAHAAITLNVAADTVLGLSAQQITLDTQTANYVWAGPTTGAAATPTFRALVAADIPAGWLLATGATTGATSQAQTFTNGIVGPTWKPAADSTTALQIQQSGGTNILNVDTTNSRVGIGNAAPGYKLHVTGDMYAASAGFGAAPTTAASLQIQKTGDASAATSYGADVIAISSVGGAYTVSGMRLIAYNNSTTAQTGQIYGVESAAFNLSSGTATSLIGNNTSIGVLSSGNVTNGYAMFINSPVIGSTGVVGTAYGLYLAAQKVTGVTTGLGLWQQGASDLNYFGSEVGFNSASWGLGQVHVTPTTAGRKGLVVRGAASQTAALLELQDSGGTLMASFSAAGALDLNSDTLRLRTARTPASASAAGNAGDICWDASYVYVAVATNTWMRATLATW